LAEEFHCAWFSLTIPQQCSTTRCLCGSALPTMPMALRPCLHDVALPWRHVLRRCRPPSP
jgi:hypothetical protein